MRNPIVVISLVVISFLLLFGWFTRDYETRSTTKESGHKLDQLLDELAARRSHAEDTKLAQHQDLPTPVPQWGILKTAGAVDSVTVQAEPVAPKVQSTAEKKNDKKKKKKVAKKKNVPKAMYVQSPSTPKTTSEAPAFGPSLGNSSYTPPVAAAPKKIKDPNNPETLEEWEEYLLKPGSYENTTKFISRYQSRLISDEWFYTLTDKLLESQNQEHHEYGLVALASSPSYNSFERLSDVKARDTDGGHRQTAAAALSRYQALQYLGILGTAIQSYQAEVRNDALRVLQKSAAVNLATATPSESPGVRGRTPYVATATGNAKYFLSFVTLLSTMEKTVKDPNSAALIKTTLVTLQNYLNSSSRVATVQ